MEIEIYCLKCKGEFEPTKEQEDLVSRALREKWALLMIECPLCKVSFPYIQDDHEGIIQEQRYPCPACGCQTVYVTDGSEYHWGCGECGRVWKDRMDLHN